MGYFTRQQNNDGGIKYILEVGSMVLLNALVSDIVFEAVRLVVLAACAVLGVLVGKKLKDSSDAKKSANKEEA